MSTGKVRAGKQTLKAARVQLGMEQTDLAAATGLALRTIVNFENAKTVSHESTREAIQSALETRGIVFTNGDRPGFYVDKSKAIIPV